MKLVRDRIPELFPGAGTYGKGRPEHIDRLLMAKVVEEVAEVFGADSAESLTEEIADVIEALVAFAFHVGVTEEEIDKVRRLKRYQRGGFKDGWVLEPALTNRDGNAPGYRSSLEPSACGQCGVRRGSHGKQYSPNAGWHSWMLPTQEQIKARMLLRRADPLRWSFDR